MGGGGRMKRIARPLHFMFMFSTMFMRASRACEGKGNTKTGRGRPEYQQAQRSVHRIHTSQHFIVSTVIRGWSTADSQSFRAVSGSGYHGDMVSVCCGVDQKGDSISCRHIDWLCVCECECASI